MASTYWSSVSADEMSATESVTESVTPSELTGTEPSTNEQPPDSSNPDASSSPPSDEPASDDISATTTPVDNSTTTLSAGNSTSPSAEVPTTSADNSTNTVPASDSTTTTTLAGNSTSDELTSQTESVPDNSTNEVTQPLPDATLSLQFDESDTSTSAVAGDATVEEKLDVASLNLDGVGDFVQVTDTGSRELTVMSLSAWIKPDYSGGSSEFTVVSKDKAFVLAINNNIPPYKVAKFSVFDGIKWSTVESTTQIGEEWTHLTATFDGSSIGIYVNGNLESTLPITGIPSLTVNGQLQLTTVDSISSDSDIVIGAYLSEKSGHSEASNQFSGSVDGVHLYDSLLEPTQISEIYNQNIISYYSSEEIEDYALVHDAIEIGKPVTWTQNVVMSEETQNVAVEIPADAQIIQVETANGENVDLSTVETTSQSAVLDNEVPLASLDFVPEMVQEEKPTELVIINEAASDYTVTFQTPAPYTIEEDQSTPELYSKEVTVTHDSALHYTNVKSYSDIPEDLVAQGTPFRLYWIIDGQRTDVTNDPRFAVEFVDTNGNGIADQMQWIVPQLSEQVFVIEAQITIINVQSYPTVGGNWTVRFTTVGMGDLIITAVDGTTFGESLPADLKFLELNNGTHTLTPTIEGNSIVFHGYSSTVEGFETSQVLTSGKHHLEFRFGNDVKYAHNDASGISFDAVSSKSGNNVNTITLVHTVGTTGTNKILIVGVVTEDGAQVSSVTYNSQPLTKIRDDQDPSHLRSELWYRLNPATDTHNIIVNLKSKDDVGVGGISLNGVDQSTGFIDAHNGAFAPSSSKTVSTSLTTTVSNDWIIDTVGVNHSPNDPSPGNGQTQRWLVEPENDFIVAASTKTTTTAGSYSMSWSVPTGSGNKLVLSAVAVKPVTIVNHPPVANNDAYSTDEDTPLVIAAPGVLGNDNDPDSNPITASLVTGPTHGTLTLNPTGGFTYTPNANYNGPDSFTYRASDGTALSNIAAVAITVNAVNDPPVNTVPGSQTVNEDGTLVFSAANGNQISVSDPDVGSGSLQVSLTATSTLTLFSTTGLTFTTGDGTADSLMVFTGTPSAINTALNGMLYQPTPNFNGAGSLSITTNDRGNTGTGGPLADSDIIPINVNAVNDAPVANNDAYSTDEDTPLVIAAPGVLGNDNDPDSNPITASLVTGPTHGTLTLNPTGGFTYTPNANYNGPDSFTYRASDGTALSNIATVNITVRPVNDAPVEQPDAYSTQEDTTLNVAAGEGVLSNDNDLDGNTLTADLVDNVDHGTLSLASNGGFTYTPDENFHGTDSFRYSANDGFVEVNTSTVTITVTSINDNPVAVNDTPTTPEDTPITISVLSNDIDVDGDTLSVTSVSTPAHGTAVINLDGTITYTPNTNFNGVDSFTYTITDGFTFSTASVIITVTPVNDFPIASSDSIDTPEDATTIVDVLSNDIDVDGDTLSVTSILAAPTNGIAVINLDGTITYTPNTNFNGIDSLVYVISDGNGGTASAILTINVEAVNNSPLAVNDTPTTPEDTPITISVLSNDIDVDGDTLSVTSVSTPAHGTAVINLDGTITYTPNTNFNGVDSFTYTITDGLEFGTATVTVSITPVNDPPVASSDSTNTPEDTPITISVLSNDIDVDGDTLSVTSILAAPTNGIAVINLDGTITYTPNTNFNGVDSFTYKANDGTADSNVATVTVDVGAINDAPVANGQSISTNEDTPLHLVLSASDSDGNVFTFTILSGPSNGILTGISPDLTYTPFTNYNGPDSFTFKVNDGLLDSSAATVDITVNSVNDAPILTPIGNKVVPENTLLTFTAVATDPADVPPNSLTFSLTGSVPPGATINSANGVFTWTPTTAQGPGVYTFDVRVTDNGSPPLSDSETITVTVTQLGPAIVSLTASDPDGVTTGEDEGFTNGDTITATFSEATNRPLVTTTTDLNNLFTFSQSIGTSYTGSWTSKSVLVITILDKTGGSPTTGSGGLTLTVKASASLKNEAGTSLPSTSTSPFLTGDFGQKAGPSIASITAADPDTVVENISNGDTITVRFSEATNTPVVATTDQVNALFTFSQSIGASYSGIWQNSRTLVITIGDSTGGTATVGVLTLTVKASGNLRDAAGTSLQSTSISPILAGTFGQKAGPFITSLIAKDPFGLTAGFGDGDTITVKFSEPTNEPAVATTADLNNLFTFSQSIGTSYTGSWFDPLTLVITIGDSTGGTATVGVLTLTVKESGNLKNAAVTSLSSTALSPVVSGTFETKPGPSIISLKANDPDGITVGELGGLTNGDTITVTFSEATNRPDPTPLVAGLSKADLDALFTFSQSIGTSYTGKWKNPLTLEITIDNSAGATASVGALTLTVNAGANLKNAENTSLVSTSISPTLTGSFGEKEGPSIKSLVADDPDNSDSIFSNGDTLNIRFSEPTNTPDPAPPGLSKADLDVLFAFSQEIGDSYSGSWIDSSTLVITILDSTTDSPPEVGALRLTVKAGGNLKDAASSSLPSISASPFLSGSFGTFVEVIPVGDGGTAYTTLPSGISTSITLPGGNSGVMTFERATGFTPPSSILVGILGDVVEISPSGGADCSSAPEGCELSFEFTTNDAVSNGLTPPVVKVLHDADDDGVFDTSPSSPEVLDGDPAGEEDTTVTGIDDEDFVAFPAFGHDLWRAIAVAHSNSKFAIGGVKALLGASLFGGGSNNVPPSVVTVTFGGNDQSSSTDTTVIGFGGRLTGSNLAPGIFKTGEPVKLSSSKIVKTGDPLTLKLAIQEEEGALAIEHVAFYVNLQGNDPQVDNSDTYVIYEKSKPITIVDPHGFFSGVNVATSQIDSMTLTLIYDFKFAKPMAKSDIIIRSWDVKRNVDDTTLLDALEVVEPGTLPRTIPDWVKNNANWWSSGQIADSDFVQGVQYLIKQGIVTIPETEAGSDSSQQIPTWIKNNAGWWAEGLISDDDFISAIQWLITNGIMKV